MATPILVNASTSIVQIDSSQIVNGSPAVVWLSTLNAPGTVVTVRDSFGDCSLTKQIVVSTTQNVRFLDGPTVSSYTINQPFGFLTVTPKTSTIWGVVNTFAFPDASRAAVMNTLNANTTTTSTLTANLTNISSLLVSTFTADSVNLNSSIVILQSTIANSMFVTADGFFGRNVVIGSTLTARSSIQTHVARITSTLEVPKLDVQFSTGVALNVAGQLLAIGAISTLSSIYAGDLISTTSNLGVGRDAFILGQLRVRAHTTLEANQSTLGTLGIGRETLLFSTLTTRDIAFFNSHVSVASNVLIAGGISTFSNVHIGGSTIMRGDLQIIGNLSTNRRVDIGGNLSVAGDLAVGGDLFFADRIVDLDNLSVTNTLYVGNTISTLSSIAAGTSLHIQGSTLFLGHVSAFSTMSVRGNVSTLGSLAVGGSAQILSTLLVQGSISTLSNLNVGGVISTPSSIIAGDILQVRNAIFGGSSLALASSLQVGGTMSVANFAYLQGALSTLGQANFFSSMQIQGSLSVMSSVAVSCNLNVNGILTAGSFNLPGAGNLLTLGVTSNAGFVATISSSTLHMGLFSSMGPMNIGGVFSSPNAIVTGSTLNANFVVGTRNISSLSNLGVGNDLQVLSNAVIGGQLSNLGAATFQGVGTFNGLTNFNANVTMNQQLNVKQLALLENTLRVYGQIDAWTGIGTKAGPDNTFSNFSYLSSIGVEGLATFSNITNARFLATSTLMASTFTTRDAITSSFSASTIATNGFITSRQNFTSSILTSTIATDSTISRQGLFSSLQASSFNLTTGVTSLQVFTSSIRASNLAINTAAPRALIDLQGGATNTGASGSNIFAIQSNAGGFRHFVATRHNNVVSTNTNSIDFFVNNASGANDSSNAGNNNVNPVSMTATGVGIFTSSPSFTLEVQGATAIRNAGAIGYGHVKLLPWNTNAENCITFYSTTTVNNTWPWMVGLLNGISPNFVIAAISNANYNASLTTHFTRDGRVGIGNQSPAFKLDVAGTGRFDTSLTIGSSFAVDLNNSGYLRVRLNGGNSSGFWYGAFNGLGDGVHMGYNAYYPNNGPAWVIPNSAGGTSRISMLYGAVGIYTGTTNTAPNTLGYYQDSAGNVGIGRTNPGFKFDVDGTSFFRNTVGIEASDFLYFQNSLGRKIALWGESAAAYYGFEIQGSELRYLVDTQGAIHQWGYGSPFVSTMRLTDSLLRVRSNVYVGSFLATLANPAVGAIVSLSNIGNSVAGSNTHFEFGSEQATNGNFTNTTRWSFMTSNTTNGAGMNFMLNALKCPAGTYNGALTTTTAMLIDTSQRVYMYASNTWNGRGQNPMPANLILADTNGSALLKLAANYTGGQGAGATIQASDFFSSQDNGVSLFINPLGGNVAIGSSNAPSNRLEVNGNTRITGNLTVTGTIAGGGSFVLGMVILWSGAANNIPTGWRLCSHAASGTSVNGVAIPNLVDRFVICAGGSYAVNSNAGSATQVLSANNLPNHGHTITDPGHSHTQYSQAATYASYDAGGGRKQGAGTTATFSATTGISVNAAITATTGGAAITGNPTSFSILPPFFALCYIIYVG